MVKNNIFVESVISITDSTKTFLRIIDSSVDESLLTWHQDELDRSVNVLNNCKGWKFQFDNEKPIDLEEDSEIYIPSEIIHRVIKDNKESTTDIIFIITERLKGK
jgi:hypothetical protein